MAKAKPAPVAAPPEPPQVHVHPPTKPYIVFADSEGVAHFMEFEAIHLYCLKGRHHVQDRFGRHYEVTGAYDIQDPASALHSYQMLCSGAAAVHMAKDRDPT